MAINLSNLSATALEALAQKALQLAGDLRKKEPSYRLALEAGVKDTGYRTVRHGWVPAYRGEAIITMANGQRWKAIGHAQRGCPEAIYQNGYIEFIPLPAEGEVVSEKN